MEQIIKQALDAMKGLKGVTLSEDFNQLNMDNPAIQLPCVLVSVKKMENQFQAKGACKRVFSLSVRIGEASSGEKPSGIISSVETCLVNAGFQFIGVEKSISKNQMRDYLLEFSCIRRSE